MSKDCSERFVRVSRKFFSDLTWRGMWRADHGPSTAILPIIAMRAGGRPGNKALIWPAELMEQASVSRAELRRARVPLVFVAGATVRASATRGRWLVSPGPFLQPRTTRGGMRIPGRLVLDLWPTLSHAEMNLILALAAQADAAACTDWIPEDVIAWVSGLSDEFFVARETTFCPEDCLRPHLRRLGGFDAHCLAGVTGMTAHEVQDAFASLADRLDGALVQDFVDGWGDHWFHLPSEFWALPSESDGMPPGTL